MTRVYVLWEFNVCADYPHEILHGKGKEKDELPTFVLDDETQNSQEKLIRPRHISFVYNAKPHINKDANSADDLLQNANLLENDNDPDVVQFRKFLSRRKVWTLIKQGKYKEVKKELTLIKDDPELSEFVQNELDYINSRQQV